MVFNVYLAWNTDPLKNLRFLLLLVLRSAMRFFSVISFQDCFLSCPISLGYDMTFYIRSGYESLNSPLMSFVHMISKNAICCCSSSEIVKYSYFCLLYNHFYWHELLHLSLPYHTWIEIQHQSREIMLV